MRFQDLKRLDIKSRNQLRHILSTGGEGAIQSLQRLRARLGREQSGALEQVLSSPALMRGAGSSQSFPKAPPFLDKLANNSDLSLPDLLAKIDRLVRMNSERLGDLAVRLRDIDRLFGTQDFIPCVEKISSCMKAHGWSHLLLRKIVAIRELSPEIFPEIEEWVQAAGLSSNAPVAASLIHSYATDQNFLTIRRSVQNIPNKGSINKFSRFIARLSTNPIALDREDFREFLQQVERCSLIDAIVLIKLNRDLLDFAEVSGCQTLVSIFEKFGFSDVLEQVLGAYLPADDDAEYVFYKQSSAWLEYESVYRYRLLVDNYYDAGKDPSHLSNPIRRQQLEEWVGDISVSKLVAEAKLLNHESVRLGLLEASGVAARSALFNYWLFVTEGVVGFGRKDLLKLMGLTRDLSRSIPIGAVRNASRVASDPLVKLILLLLLAKRSKNEFDAFQLRKLLEAITIKEHGGSLVLLVEHYYSEYPYISEYIYDIATEDFLAKLSRLTPHLADIPDLRASLHEWMARSTGESHYAERARAVRIDHQLNRVRNEIDDHRIYVDPSRFSSWIQDEMMIELSSALAATGGGKKAVAVGGDELLLSHVVTRCYSAFCSNAIFGIASYIGRRIRHGTFHGHLFSSVVNGIESQARFSRLLKNPGFSLRWESWKASYDEQISRIVVEKLHVNSKSKPDGLLQPENYSPFKQDVISAAVRTIIAHYGEHKTTEGIDKVITDYCWRLAESDLLTVTTYLTSQKQALKSGSLIDDLVACCPSEDLRLVGEFKRELIRSIDQKLASIIGWFKRPSNLAPKASLALLYDAVVREVQDSFPNFKPQTEVSSDGDVELAGGVYHIMYDSLAVVVSNAAKYGDQAKPVRRNFSVEVDPAKGGKKLVVEIASVIRAEDDPINVAQAIDQRKLANFEDANLYETKSGIPKLMQLSSIRQDFFVEYLGVRDREVVARFAYALQY